MEFFLKKKIQCFIGESCHMLCIFMGYIEMEFLRRSAIKPIQPWLWKRFINYISFILDRFQGNLIQFLENLNEFHPNLKFLYEKTTLRAFKLVRWQNCY